MELKKRQEFIFLSFIFLITYLLGVSLRLWEANFWNNPAYYLDGEPLMATHDAYAWLAGAIDVGRLTGRPMSLLLKYLSLITGIKVATLNFWLPAIIAPLACLPVILICKLFEQVEAGLLAGSITILGSGYLLRTRLGYGDTDILTLFLPLSFCWGLILWLKPFFLYFNKKLNPVKDNLEIKDALIAPLITGLILNFYYWFYPSAYPIIMYTLLFTLLLAYLFLPKATFKQLLPGFILIFALGLNGIYGFIVSLIFIYLFYFSNSTLKKNKLLLLYFLLSLVIFFFRFKLGGILELIKPVFNYVKLFPFLVSDKYSLKLPAVMQSIREAQSVSFSQLIARVGLTPYIFFPGLLGFLLTAYFRPLLLIFLPQLLLALLSFKLGNRFTMYGPPIIGLGLALGVGFIFQKIKIKPLILYLLLTLFFIFPVTALVKNLRPSPVLPKIYAQALKEAKTISSPKTWFWQWWDYGYAAQYYTQRKSFGDGGAHEGPYLYPLALVHTTSSPLQASQVIKYVISDVEEQIREMQKNGTKPQNPGSKVLYWPAKVLKHLDEMGPEKAQAFINSLRRKELTFASDLPEQYLVFSWENLNLSYWISYFGQWDLLTGTSTPGKIKTLQGKLHLDLNQGTLNIKGKRLPILKILLIGEKGTRELSWNRPKGLYLIFNSFLNNIKAMDSTIYNSLMVQMLLKNPKLFEPYFELVIDKSPWVRIYKVR